MVKKGYIRSIENKERMNKKGVFGLNAIQQFFVVILGIALLAYVIVVIMGALGGSTILPPKSNSVINETTVGGISINDTGYTLKGVSNVGFASPVITAVWNGTAAYNTNIPLANFTVSTDGVVKNTTGYVWKNVSISYTYNSQSTPQAQSDSILSNVSTGVSSFFSAINPVYAILAVLVIILVLVVLVRVVQTPNAQGSGAQL